DGGRGGVLEIQEHDVKVTINNGIAVTQVTQIFRNTEQRQVEALYTFPVPKSASVANFSMWIAGKEMVGEVLEKKRAREIYESYKQQKRDPGLLEQTDFRTFEMRIFPIAAGAEQKVQITYYQELDFDHDWATYVYPLATSTRGRPDTRTTGRFAINVDVQSAIPIAALESPSHPGAFVIAKHSEGYAQASLETKGGSLAQDVVLACHLERPRTGIDVLTSARAGQDGFFCATLSAGADAPGKETGADYVFVLDFSGSMRDDGKLLLSKDCLGEFIRQLGADDRFELMTFNIQPHLAFNGKRAADAKAKQDALAFLTAAQAGGGTVLNPAITTAYKYADADRPLNVVILSDGLTDQSERRSLLELIGARPRNAKVFCIGVGNDVNRPLLEQLAGDSGGLASFLSPGDDFARQAKAFRRKLMNPVATDLQMTIGGSGIEILDVEPKQMPNLFHGSPVRVYGRYRGSGPAKLALRGNLNGVEWKESADLELPKEDATNPEIERMWASRRIDALLKADERAGTRNQSNPEVVRLGEEFSIVTEYTSFLVLENDAELQRWKIERRNAARLERDRAAQGTRDLTLNALQRKAIADLGPQPETAESRTPAPSSPAPLVSRNAPVSFAPPPPGWQSRSQGSDIPPPRRSESSGSGWSLGGGSGPVGPLFVVAAAWLARLKRRARPQG
ncbi:MAG TPA: VIT domain-containing protein, partial [Chthoniobacteraceae bacterium]|nr:VIT domain-containing protein [Chthoniobacteraceae bacterium]